MPFIILIAILAIAAIIAVAFIKKRNYFKTQPVNINQALSNIDVALTKRASLLSKQLEVCKGYAKHEFDTFSGIVQLRKGMTATEMSEVEAQLNEVQNRIAAVAESYPELRSNKVFQNLQSTINLAEDDIAAARRVYNMQVSEFNKEVVTFPSSIVANSVGAKQLDMFVATAEQRADVDIKF